MKLVSVKQNGKEWREWRGRGLGASNAAVIMGVSPYQNAFELWLELTGMRAREPFNEYAIVAMKRGVELEPKAREIFERKMGHKFPAESAEHDTYDFIRASFDGYCKELNALVEIKCPGKVDHATALKGKVPKHYYPQIQQQLMVANADICYYASWDGVSDEIVVVPVKADPVYQAQLTVALIDFWKRVTEKVLPEVSSKDILKLVKSVEKDLTSVNSAVAVFRLLSEKE